MIWSLSQKHPIYAFVFCKQTIRFKKAVNGIWKCERLYDGYFLYIQIMTSLFRFPFITHQYTKRSGGQGSIHQHSTCSLYVCKFRSQLFCACVLGLYFTCSRLLAQKLCIERWWNWNQAYLHSMFSLPFHISTLPTTNTMRLQKMPAMYYLPHVPQENQISPFIGRTRS